MDHNLFVDYRSAIINSFTNTYISMIPEGPIIGQIQLSSPFNK